MGTNMSTVENQLERSTEDASFDDPELHESGAQVEGATIMHLQRQLSLLLDNTELRRFVMKLFEAQLWPRLRQLQQLRLKGVSHGWLWQINPCDGSLMNEQTSS